MRFKPSIREQIVKYRNRKFLIENGDPSNSYMYFPEYYTVWERYPEKEEIPKTVLELYNLYNNAQDHWEIDSMLDFEVWYLKDNKEPTYLYLSKIDDYVAEYVFEDMIKIVIDKLYPVDYDLVKQDENSYTIKVIPHKHFKVKTFDNVNRAYIKAYADCLKRFNDYLKYVNLDYEIYCYKADKDSYHIIFTSIGSMDISFSELFNRLDEIKQNNIMLLYESLMLPLAKRYLCEILSDEGV